jgi:signal transduction histidine kinase
VRRWRGWSLHRRIVVVAAATATLVLVLGVAAFTAALDRVLYSAAQDAARTRLADVVSVVSAGHAPAGQALHDIPGRGSLLQVLDTRHHVVAASEEAISRTPITPLRPRPGDVRVAEVAGIPGELGEPYALAVQGVQTPDGSALVVVVASPLDVEATSVRSATILLALGAAALLLVLVYIISRSVRKALEPVERIRSEVARITHARGQEHISVPPTGDEIARLAQTMNLMLARLGQADVASRRFISDASHELRSPLATIRAAVEVPAGADHTSIADRDRVIHDEAMRMQRLVDDLLLLAKADDGLPLRIEEVDLDDLVEAEVRRLRATAEVSVTASIAAARVMGDRLRLAQVVRNLVDNAVAHSRGAIALAVSSHADGVVLTVDNDGPAIPEDKRELVFDRFARLEESRARDHGGSGLGLAIVRTLVEAHGGTVRAAETPVGTCRFDVRLPAVS